MSCSLWEWPQLYSIDRRSTVDPGIAPTERDDLLTSVEQQIPVKGFCPAGSSTVSPTESLLFVSTLDGDLHAVSKRSGSIKWTLKEEYTITMYDTKSREVRWNATYSDYASTLPDDDTKYTGTT
ncbi:hypothetical protein CRUP_007448 [Coryphaenoides rupestris]|nr:hypothetical protein CRUP_007448 [Coryphaenoides rupestris]